jgi:outer membrane protein OmpA-like peptidoglycan-associated protein
MLPTSNPISAILYSQIEYRAAGGNKETSMKNIKPTIFAATAVTVCAISLGGCATKTYVNEQVATVDAKVQATQGQVNQHQTHLDQLDQTTREALDRATAAGKLAEGKFLYEMVLSDDSVKFPVDSAKLSPEAEQRLTTFADKLKSDNRNVYLEIQGHTDSRGSANLNQHLGEERAEAVRLFMNQHGVPLNRMATISYGKEDPVASNKTRNGRAQNRRVVLIVMS